MKIKNLKKRPIYYRAKYALVGGLVGAIASTGAVTFVNGMLTGYFKPMVSKEDKITTSEVTTSIYSKEGKKVTKSFEYGSTDEKIVVFKYQNDNVDTYSKFDISRLNKEQLNYIKSKLNVTDSNDLEALRYYVYNHSAYVYQDLNIEDYFDSSEKYGVKYIVKDCNKNNTRQTYITDSDKINALYRIIILGATSVSSIGLMAVVSAKTCAEAYELEEERKKKYLKK